MQPINPNDYRHPRTLKEAFGHYTSEDIYHQRRSFQQTIGRWGFSETIHIALIAASVVFMVFVLINYFYS